MKIYSPNKEYTGVSASGPFCNGMGETDDPYLIAWFRTHGYKVEEGNTKELSIEESADEEPAEKETVEEAPVKPVKKKAGQ